MNDAPISIFVVHVGRGFHGCFFLGQGHVVDPDICTDVDAVSLHLDSPRAARSDKW